MAEVKLTVWFNTDVTPYDAEPWKPEPQEGTVVERLFKNLTAPNPIVRNFVGNNGARKKQG